MAKEMETIIMDLITYEQAEKLVFAHGNVPDGYFGQRRDVDFVLNGRQVIAIADYGFYRVGLPDVIDEQEALYLLQHHPSARNIIVS